MGKNRNRQKSAMNRILVMQLILMLLLLLGVSFFIAYKTRQNALEQMSALNGERALIINNYVDNAEKTLIAYSHAKQISALLKDPDNEKLKAEAQDYTEEFSKDIPFIEGIYVSQWDTKVMAHTNPLVPGMTTRNDPDSLAELHDGMTKAGRGVYDTGIIISPASGKQIISMYKIVKDDSGNPIGFVGLGIFTDKLVDALKSVESDSTFFAVNATDNNYIFHNDSENNRFFLRQF